MKLYTIDNHNNIVVYASAADAPADQLIRFAGEKELALATQQWPAERILATWNSFAGVAPFGELKPVKKFTDRKTAVARIWKTIQRMDPPVTEAAAAPATTAANRKKLATTAPQGAQDAQKKTKTPKDATAKDAAPQPREGSKKATVIEMLGRPSGATLKEIMAATAWQAHSVRGFIAGALAKKMGIIVKSTRTEAGDRNYKIG